MTWSASRILNFHKLNTVTLIHIDKLPLDELTFMKYHFQLKTPLRSMNKDLAMDDVREILQKMMLRLTIEAYEKWISKKEIYL